MSIVSPSNPLQETASRDCLSDRAARWMLWVDRVGAFLVCRGDSVSIGGPTAAASADIPLLANLSREHARLLRQHEQYLLEACSPCTVNGVPVTRMAELYDGRIIGLGSSVKLGFRLPSVVSATARLELTSGHRPAHACDGILLMHDTCLLGPGSDCHIRCESWPETVVLFAREGRLWCKSRVELCLEGSSGTEVGPLQDGAVVTGPELRFRIENICDHSPPA